MCEMIKEHIMFKIFHQQKHIHSAHLKPEGGAHDSPIHIDDRNDYLLGVPKHTSLFYLDKYRFVAGDHKQGESVRMLCFISKSVPNSL